MFPYLDTYKQRNSIKSLLSYSWILNIEKSLVKFMKILQEFYYDCIIIDRFTCLSPSINSKKH